MTPQLRFSTVGLTHEGGVRSANEDSLVLRDEIGMWAIADGMGGHENGQWASATIISAIAEINAQGDFDLDVAAAQTAVGQANDKILEQSESAGKRMGSTVVALMAADRRFVCLWAGDSRLYRLRGKKLEQLTRDHTQVQDMLAKGLLSPEEAHNHPMGHVLSRAVGVERPVRLDTITGDIAAGDVFLLCSDGLSGQVSAEEIEAHLATADARTAGRRLLDLTLARGAPDNVTLITVQCEEMTALTVAGEA